MFDAFSKKISKLSVEAIFTIIILLTFLISTFGISILDKASVGDAAYWTMCALTSSNCFVSLAFYELPTVRIFAFINGVGFIIIISFLAAEIVDRLGRINMKEKDMARRMEDLKDHFIICGYGRVGEKIANIMNSNKMSFVVVDKNPETVTDLKEMGGFAIEGDALDTRTLEKAGIKRATGLIAVLDKDTDNISLVLTAKDINPDLMIGARADSEDAIRRLHRAGAEIVVIPEIVGGIELAKAILKLEEIEGQEMVSKK